MYFYSKYIGMAVTGSNSLMFANGMDNSGLAVGINQAVNMVSGMANKISKINPFLGIALAAGAALGTVSVAAFNMMSSFESAMNEVRTIAGVSGKEFEDLKDDVFDLYKQLGTEPPDQLAKGLYEIIGAGYEATDAIKLLEIASKAAVAGVTSTAVASDGLTTILNSFQLEVSEAERIADIMFATVDRGKVSFEELSRQVAQVAPLAAASGISFDEIGGAIATLTKQGVPAAQAFTQVRAAIIATNEEMGDGVFNAYSFQEAMQAMYDKANGSQNALKNMVGRIEGVNGILALAGPNFQGAAEDLEAMSNAAGSVNKSFNIISESGGKKWEKFYARIKATTKGLGENLVEASSGLADFLLDITEGADAVVVSIDKEKRALFEAEVAILDVNTKNEKRLEIIDKLKKQYPAYLGHLNSETASNEEVTAAIRKANISLTNNILLREKQIELENASQEEAKAKKRVLDAEDAITQKIYTLREKYNINIKEGLNYLERAKDVQSQLPAEARKVVAAFGSHGSSTWHELQSLINELDNANNGLTEAMDGVEKEMDSKRDLQVRLGLIVEGGDTVEKTIKEQLAAIASAKTNDELSQYLKSENEKIRTAAENRKKEIINALAGGGGDIEGFKDMLDQRRDQYEAYYASVKQLGKEEADESNKDLLKQGQSYGDFLLDLLEKTKDFSRRRLIALSAEEAGIDLQRETVKALELKPKPIQVEVELNEKSVDQIRAQINSLQSRYDKSRSDTDRKRIADTIAARRLDLEHLNRFLVEVTEDSTQKEKELYENVHTTIEDLNYKQLQGYIEYWKNRLITGQNSAEKEIAINTKIQQAESKLVEKKIKMTSSLIGEASRLFRALGNESIAKVLDDLNELGSALGNTLNVFNNESSTGLEKATSVMALASVALQKATQIVDKSLNSAVDKQKEINQGIADQLVAERKINELRRERAEIEKNSSAFFRSNFQRDFADAIALQADSNVRLDESMRLLSQNGIFTQEGIGKRLLGGKNRKTFDFAISDILGDFDVKSMTETAGFWASPLGSLLTGSYSKRNAQKDAIRKLRDSFNEALTSMGKTAGDMANFSNQEWIDFFQTLDAMGKVTDETTKKLLEEGKKAVEDYRAAVETMKNVISDLAGMLSTELRNSLVDSFKAGTDAAVAMGDAVSKVLEDMVTQMVFDSVFRKQFDKLQKDMEKSLGTGGDGSFIDDFGDFFKASKNLNDSFTRALEEAKAAAGAYGLDIFQQGSGNQQTLSGSIQGITEDQADLLAGAINGMRIEIFNGVSILRDNRIYLASINVNTFEIIEQIKISNVRLNNIETSLS